MENLLKKAWANHTLEEILCTGLDMRKIDSSDIIHASDIYRDPNKEYLDEEVQEIIKDRGLHEILVLIQDEYSLDDIIDELGKNDVLDSIDEDDRLESIKFTTALEDHDDEVLEKYKYDCREEVREEIEAETADCEKTMNDYSADDLRQHFCDLFGLGYYDDNGLFQKFRELFEKLEKSTYKNKEELRWLLTKE